MFFILATKPLNDDTKGFRFTIGFKIGGNFYGFKGLTRKRTKASRGWFKREQGQCMSFYHFGKRTVYFEHRRNRIGIRKLWHFAG